MKILSFLIFCIVTSCSISFGHGQNTEFNVMKYGALGNGQTDDSSAFSKAWLDLCKTRVNSGSPTLIIPQGKTFLLQPLTFNGSCQSDNVLIKVLGNLVAPEMAAWKNTSSGWWLRFSDITNLKIDGSGQLDGKGADWWNSAKHKGGGNTGPGSLSFHNCNGLHLNGFTSINSPRSHISLNGCNGATLSHINLIAPIDSLNTDGVDISQSTEVIFEDSFVGTGDDCVAINGGSSHINITRVTCAPGHGISVGSLGKDGATETVEEVHVQHCTFNGTQNGARIKTWQGGSGYARKISFEDIILINSGNPIIIDQKYCPDHTCQNSTRAVKVSDVTFSGIHGTSTADEAIKLDCSNAIGCSGIIMKDINISSSDPEKKTTAICNNAHGMFSNVIPKVSCSPGQLPWKDTWTTHVLPKLYCGGSSIFDCFVQNYFSSM